MWQTIFLNRLRKQLPEWVAHGWVAPEHQAAILEYAESSAGRGVQLLPVVLGVLGVLTLGAGVIMFFAANWAGMAKLTKLGVLFGGMWATYAAAGWLLYRSTTRDQMLGQALMLLGVILFGANIMLIAQIYHIDAHYPNGVLFWSLGALAITYVAPVQPVAVAGLGLAGLWTGMEAGAFERAPHWEFLVVWFLFLPPIFWRGWRYAAMAAAAALLFWNVMLFGSWTWREPELLVYLVPAQALAAVALLLLGVTAMRHSRLLPFATIAERAGLIGVGLAFLVLIDPSLHGYGGYSMMGGRWQRLEQAPVIWMLATLIVAAVVVALAALRYRQRTGAHRGPAAIWAYVLLAALTVLTVANLFVPPISTAVFVVHVAYMALNFAGLLWLIAAGLAQGNRFQVNIGFLFFALSILIVYFDTFWTLMNRSFFFMGGGLLLVIGGYLLERQRRRLLRRFGPAGQGGQS